MKKNYSHIELLVDRSGSMARLHEAVVSGLNKFVKDQKALPGTATLSVTQFDDHYENLFDGIDVNFMAAFSMEEHFVPRGGTALVDSFAKRIVQLGEKLSKMKEEDRPENVIFVVFTDGQENSSREYKKEQLKEMVDRQTNQFSWKFLFLGANMDAIGEAGGYGMAGANFNASVMGMAKGAVYGSSYTAAVRGGDKKLQTDLLSVSNVEDVDAEEILKQLKTSVVK